MTDGFWMSLAAILTVIGTQGQQMWKVRADRKQALLDKAEAKAERLALAEHLAEQSKKLDTVASNVDGHLSKITKALSQETKLNVALTVENDRLNEGTTTAPVAQTPESDAHLTRDPVDGTATLNERRQP